MKILLTYQVVDAHNRIIKEFERKFSSEGDAARYYIEQNQHPWLTLVEKSRVEIEE